MAEALLIIHADSAQWNQARSP